MLQNTQSVIRKYITPEKFLIYKYRDHLRHEFAKTVSIQEDSFKKMMRYVKMYDDHDDSFIQYFASSILIQLENKGKQKEAEACARDLQAKDLLMNELWLLRNIYHLFLEGGETVIRHMLDEDPQFMDFVENSRSQFPRDLEIASFCSMIKILASYVTKTIEKKEKA